MLLDTSAWIEFFNKTENYNRVTECLQAKKCFTSIVSIAEISQWAQRENVDGQLVVSKILELSELIQLSPQIAFIAGELNHQRKKENIKWGMMDSLIVTTARTYNLSILTKDTHFKDLPKVELI